MTKRFLRVVFALLGCGLGCGVAALLFNFVYWPGYELPLQYTTELMAVIGVYVILSFIFGLIFYAFSPKCIDAMIRFFTKLHQKISGIPAMDMLFGVLGLMGGLVLAFLLSLIVNMIQLSWLTTTLNILLYILCGWFGLSFAVSRRAEIMNGGKRHGSGGCTARPKVLDTSVIIDGRIVDVCRTGIVEGEIIVPAFVLKELRHIADYSDPVRRNRGRRGLDILTQMQDAFGDQVRVVDTDYEDVDEVDLKLLRLANELGGVLLTNDYNLNKVAAVQQTSVFNINDLANALKPVLLPGEELRMAILKEGKEPMQGLGYLPDGTMVIVENGKRCIGETVDLLVTSTLQTSAGRLIFAKRKGA